MKILFIPYGTEKAPATRYRVTQYLPHLKKRNIDTSVFSAISRFSTSLMIKSPDFPPFMRFLYYIYVFIEKLFRLSYIVATSKGFDVIFLQRTTFPCNLEKFLKILNPNIIFDIDDAIYLTDSRKRDFITRLKGYIKKREVIEALKVSKAVIVENDYIKDFVSGYCKNVFKIPGPIDTERFCPGRKNESDGVVIGWIGSSATTMYLHMLDGVFKALREKYKFIKFKFIGLGKYENPPIDFEKVTWSYETEVRQLQDFDIGIMPMPDDEWTRGKLGCKMLQYMACSMPAVVSFTPTNSEIIENEKNGFFARNTNEWIRVLSKLIEDRNLRESIGEKGRATIQKTCALSENIERLSNIFNKIKRL